jgi:hypothetical protein
VTERCQEFTISNNIQNAIQVGPSESTVPALSIYNWFSNDVVTIEGTAEAFLNFTSTSAMYLYTSGKTSWQIFEDQRFQGQSVCASGEYNELERFDVWDLRPRLERIGSVILGCDTMSSQQNIFPSKFDVNLDSTKIN